MKLEHLTAHWTWIGLSKAISNIKVDLKGLQILTPNLRQNLQDFLYACGLNLTAHRIMVFSFTYEHFMVIHIILTFYFSIFSSKSKIYYFYVRIKTEILLDFINLIKVQDYSA